MILPLCAFLLFLGRVFNFFFFGVYGFRLFLVCFCVFVCFLFFLCSCLFSNCCSCRRKPNFIVNVAQNSHQLVRSYCQQIHVSAVLKFFLHFIHCRFNECFKSQNLQEFQGISLQLSPSSKKKVQEKLGKGFCEIPS